MKMYPKNNSKTFIPDFHQDDSSNLFLETIKNAEYMEPMKALKVFRRIQSESDHSEESSSLPLKTIEKQGGIKQRFQKRTKAESVQEKLAQKKKTAEEKHEEEKKKKQSKKEERKRLKEQRKVSKQLEKLSAKAARSESEEERSSGKFRRWSREKERCTTIERTWEEKRALHVEIDDLRRTREHLVNEKCSLTDKLKLEFKLSKEEMRRLVECGETIEAIDEVIQRKNEMILGKKDFSEYEEQREKGAQMLMEQLARLTEGEIKALFYKYFLKVIDVKESAKEREQEIRDLEIMYNKRIQDLQIAMQKKLKEIMQCTYWPVTKEGSEMELKLVKYKKENRQLKHQLANVKALLTGSVVPRTTSPPRSKSNATTTVTVQRNKMVILRTVNPINTHQVEK